MLRMRYIFSLRDSLSLSQHEFKLRCCINDAESRKKGNRRWRGSRVFGDFLFGDEKRFTISYQLSGRLRLLPFSSIESRGHKRFFLNINFRFLEKSNQTQWSIINTFNNKFRKVTFLRLGKMLIFLIVSLSKLLSCLDHDFFCKAIECLREFQHFNLFDDLAIHLVHI